MAARSSDRSKRPGQSRFPSVNSFISLMNQAPAMAWVKDSTGQYVYSNNAFVQAYGRPSKSILKTRDDELWPPDIAGRCVESDKKVRREGMVSVGVKQLGRSAETMRTYLVYKFPLTGAGRKFHVGGIAIDAAKSLNAQNAAVGADDSTRQIEECARLKNEIMSAVSHEIRGPLTGILGFAELLYDDKTGALAPKQKEYLGEILVSARSILDSLNRIPALASEIRPSLK